MNFLEPPLIKSPIYLEKSAQIPDLPCEIQIEPFQLNWNGFFIQNLLPDTTLPSNPFIMSTKNAELQPHLRKILQENFAILKSKNKTYSLRSYAKKVGVSATALSEMMNGKRAITRKTAIKILENLDLSSKEKEKINKLELCKKAYESEQKKYFKLDAEQYHMISDWYYFAILSLSETHDFSDDAAWVAERLNIPVSDAKDALEKFEQLQILKKDEAGTLRPPGVSFKMSVGTEQQAFRKRHADNLKVAVDSLERFAPEFADFSSMTMSVDCELIPEAKELILNFRRKLAQFLESGKKEEVYKLNIQLFPLTNPKERIQT